MLQTYLPWPEECSPGCPTSWIGDGICDDPVCMTFYCNMDAADCYQGVYAVSVLISAMLGGCW